MIAVQANNSAVLAVARCLSVCHKQVVDPLLYRNGWTNRAVFFARRLPSIYSTLCYKEIRLPSKIRVTPLELLSLYV